MNNCHVMTVMLFDRDIYGYLVSPFLPARSIPVGHLSARLRAGRLSHATAGQRSNGDHLGDA